MENNGTMSYAETNSKLLIRIDEKENSKSFKFQNKTLNFPNNLPCQINNLEICLNVNEGQDNGSDEVSEINRYTGSISGVFSVPKMNFNKQFFFKIPFSIKYGTAIALNFKTNDFKNEQMSSLNRFIFGEENIKPIVITKEVAVEIATYLISNSKGFDKLKNFWEKACDFISKNNISLNFLIDHSEQKYQVGFFWEEFVLEGMPKEIQIKDIMFGLSIDLKPGVDNKFALKIGGKGAFGKNRESSLYIEYGLDTREQRLEVGGTISCLTSLLELMSVKIPPQIQDFAKNTTLSVEWITDVTTNISEEMKLGEI